MRDTAGGVSGMTPDLLREALRRIGCELEFVELPWARAVQQLAQGRLDLLGEVTRTPERERYALYSEEFRTDETRLYVRRPDAHRWPVRTLAELAYAHLKVAVEIGEVLNPEFDRARRDPAFRSALVEVSRRESQWAMLAAGRVDAVLADAQVAGARIARGDLPVPIVAHPDFLLRSPSYVAFSRTRVDPERVALFNAALKTMHADGSYAAILRRYGRE
jgi:polar amino acid transport system substrate-binding protein